MSLTPVQISTPSGFGGTLSASTTLTGVTAGNTILVVVTHGDRGGNSPSLPVSDGQGSYTADVTTTAGGGVARVVIARLANANAGTHTISTTASAGTAAQSIGEIVALEVSPVTLDQSNIAGGTTGTTPSVSATATLAGTGELALAGLYFDGLSAGGGTFPPTGGPGTFTEIVAHTNQSDTAYQVSTSTAGVGAAWGTFTQSSKWAAAIGVYKAVVVSVVPTRSLLGVGA